MKKIRWAIVGPGGIARKFVDDLAVAGGGSVYAVASRSMERAQKSADQFGAARAFDNVTALAKDDAVDIVYIATPHQAHFDTAEILLQCGKPVLLEKPLTVNVDQARRLVQIARSNNVFLMEGLWTRFLPIYEDVRRWLDEGQIGRIRWVQSSFCVRGELNPAKRWMNPDLAGGSLLDLGVYCMAMTQFVFRQNPENITAVASVSESRTDEMLSASLEYPGGALAGFVCGFVAGVENRLVIAGEDGRVEIPDNFIAAQSATLVRGSSSVVVEKLFEGGGFEYEIREAHRCINEGDTESPLMPLDDTISNLQVMDYMRAKIGLKYPFE